MLTFLATVFGIFLLLGGGFNIIVNLKKDFEEILKGVGTIFVGIIILVLCRG